MSFTFGNTSVRIAGVEHFDTLAAQRNAERLAWLNQWHSRSAMVIDFAAAGLDPANIPMDLTDCKISYEFTGVNGHLVFLTEYASKEAMDKDAAFLNAADSVGALVRRGLQCAITMDGPTGKPFRSALIRARKAA